MHRTNERTNEREVDTPVCGGVDWEQPLCVYIKTSRITSVLFSGNSEIINTFIKHRVQGNVYMYLLIRIDYGLLFNISA